MCRGDGVGGMGGCNNNKAFVCVIHACLYE